MNAKSSRVSSMAVCIAAILTACQHSPAESHTKRDLEKGATQVLTFASRMMDAGAAVPFEGEIQLEMHQPKESSATSLTYEIKGDKVRYDEKKSQSSAKPDVHTLADLDQHKAYEVIDAKKSYVEVDPTSASREAVPAQLKTTGKTEKIAGLECEDWQITDGQEKLDVCAAKGIPYFDLSGEAKGGGEEPAWAAELTKAKAFPLRMVVHDSAGKEEMRVETTSVQNKKVDDALFAPPTDFHKEVTAKHVHLRGIP